MCLSLEDVNTKMVRWGSEVWRAGGYGANLGYSSDSKMSVESLSTVSFSGGAVIDLTLDDMPADVAEIDAKITQMSEDHIVLSKCLFVTPDKYESMKSRSAWAKKQLVKIPGLPADDAMLEGFVKRHRLLNEDVVKSYDFESDSVDLREFLSIKVEKMNKFRKTLDQYNKLRKSLVLVLEVLLDSPKISEFHPYAQKRALQLPS